MKILIGQLAIILLVLGGMGLSYLDLSSQSYFIGIPLIIWTLIFIPLGIWTRRNPKNAFLTTMIFYLVSVIIKDLLIGGEYLLPFIIHIYFIFSMIIGMSASTPKPRS